MATQGSSRDHITTFEMPVAPSPRMTEVEFVTWAFRERVNAEWIDGKVVVMSPVKIEHDRICTWMLRLLAALVEQDDLGSVHGPEFQVRFPSVPSLRNRTFCLWPATTPTTFERHTSNDRRI
jgi:hypothetical protein